MRVHLCISIRGALKNWNTSDFMHLFKRDDGTTLTAQEAREYLLDELESGKKVLPVGDCDNFDFQNGCKGHPDVEVKQ